MTVLNAVEVLIEERIRKRKIFGLYKLAVMLTLLETILQTIEY